MKAIIFTLDSIFALIIAVASVSLLAYFFYTPQTTDVLSFSSAASTLQALISTNMSSVAQSNPIYANVLYQAAASSDTWDQFMAGAYFNGGNSHGPLSPSISFVSVLPTSTGTISRVAVDYGRLYFVMGSTLYCENATTGNVLWSKSIGGATATAPIIASGELIYANALNLTAINPITNSIIWSVNAVVDYAQPIAYNNKVYAVQGLGSTHVVSAYYVNNGTQAWAYSVPTAGGGNGAYISMASGSIAFITSGSSSTIGLIEDFGTSGNVIWSSTAAQALYGLAASKSNGQIVYMGPSVANIINIDGTSANSFSISTQAYGQPTIYNNVAYFQTSGAVMAVSTTNDIALWTTTVPASYGTAVSAAQPGLSSMPIVGGGNVYTSWSNGYVLALNTTTGTTTWVTQVPYAGSLYIDAVAYGRLYTTLVPSSGNDEIIAFGACNAGPSGSILAVAASQYLNGRGSCADALLSNYAPMSNYSIFLNNTYAPGMDVANFALPDNYIQTGSLLTFDRFNPITVSFWMKTSTTAQDGFLVDDGNGLGGTSAGFVVWLWHGSNVVNWRFEDTSGNIYAPGGVTNVEDDKWHHIVVTYDGLGSESGMKIYVDGKLDGTGANTQISASINPTATQYNAELAIGAANQDGYYPYTGSIANVQIYNSSLSAAQVVLLYYGGIQNPPLNKTNLYAWYPLAGDANDYSGFADTGYPINMVYAPTNYLPTRFTNSFQSSAAGVPMPILNYTTGLPKMYRVSVVSWH